MSGTNEVVSERPPVADRGRWRTAVGLSFVVLLLSIFDAFALVLVPLGILLVGLPENRRLKWFIVGGLVWFLALGAPGEGLVLVSRGWALILGAAFLGVTLVRPMWDVTSRALVALGAALGLGSVALLASRTAGEMDRLVREHFVTLAEMAATDIQARMPDAGWPDDLSATLERFAGVVTDVFPALLALQSLAALALVAWWIRRIGRSESRVFLLSRLRDFRFNDQLIWVLVVALTLLLLPLGPEATRLGWNLAVFMAGLYALRGFAVFVFLATGSRSVPTMVLGTIALVVLYRVAFTAALLMGVGDTWLDVRRRVATAKPA